MGLRTQGTKRWFPFFLISPKLGAEETTHLEMATYTDKKVPIKSAYFSKRTRKEVN
jgi:hypothetical protein